jgi:hypothetical protein
MSLPHWQFLQDAPSEAVVYMQKNGASMNSPLWKRSLWDILPHVISAMKFLVNSFY